MDRRLILFLGGISLAFSLPQWGMEEFLAMPSDNIDSSEHGKGPGSRSTSCDCGWTNKARVVGGVETLPNEYPLMAGLLKKENMDIICGAAIITERHLLTAAHCTYRFKPENLAVTVGEHGRIDKYKTGNAQVIDVELAIEHELWNSMSYLHDISMLVLKERMKFNQVVGPACLPPSRTKLVSEYIKVLGWGNLGLQPKDKSNVLMKVNLRVIPIDTCMNNYPRDIPVDNPHQICTYNNKKDSCEGDSGGPLIWLDPETNRYSLVALVSYGRTKCATHSPAVNTDVSYFLKWIHDKIKATDPQVKTCSKI